MNPKDCAIAIFTRNKFNNWVYEYLGILLLCGYFVGTVVKYQNIFLKLQRFDLGFPISMLQMDDEVNVSTVTSPSQ